ncbi:hypothetical protein C8J57DRAFT_1581025 [Mycena rebaudengoi]|nr:hypothetical protein C8J57DRAFT_1581025 [Mycena rebaudengoi]
MLVHSNDAEDYATSPTGTTAALRLKDVHILKEEFATGGMKSFVHSPADAVLWVEAHYGDLFFKSMRAYGVTGPIAVMLSADIPALVIFGSFLDDTVARLAQLIADWSGFMVMLRPAIDDPVLTWNLKYDPFCLVNQKKISTRKMLAKTERTAFTLGPRNVRKVMQKRGEMRSKLRGSREFINLR